MKNIGSYLRNIREDKKISLETVADKTKIQIHILKKIEEDDTDFIGGDGYTKMMFLSIAKAIGIDEGNFLNYYEDQMKIKPEKLAEKKKAEATSSVGCFFKNVFSYTAIIVALIGIFYVFIKIVNIQETPVVQDQNLEDHHSDFFDEADSLLSYSESEIDSTDLEENEVNGLKISTGSLQDLSLNEIFCGSQVDYVDMFLFEGSDSPFNVRNITQQKDN